jgi:DNA polymerase-4
MAQRGDRGGRSGGVRRGAQAGQAGHAGHAGRPDRAGLRAAGVTLKVRLGDFTTFTRAATLEGPTDLAEPLYAAARELLRTKADFLGQGVRLLGLTATRLVARGEHTEGLFHDEGHERRKRAAATVDRLRKRFGADAVTLGRLLEARPDNTGTPSDTPREEE